MAVKHVRLWPSGNFTFGTSWATIGGVASAKAWEELVSAAKEEAYEGNPGALKPSEATGIVASATTSPIAAFKVPNYVLAGNEKILAASVHVYFKEVTTASAMVSAGGGGIGGNVVAEKQQNLAGTTPALWNTLAYTAEDVTKLNVPGTLKEVLEAAAVDARMIKAKEVRVFALYFDLEIEVTETEQVGKASVLVSGGGVVTRASHREVPRSAVASGAGRAVSLQARVLISSVSASGGGSPAAVRTRATAVSVSTSGGVRVQIATQRAAGRLLVVSGGARAVVTQARGASARVGASGGPTAAVRLSRVGVRLVVVSGGGSPSVRLRAVTIRLLASGGGSPRVTFSAFQPTPIFPTAAPEAGRVARGSGAMAVGQRGTLRSPDPGRAR